mmetsp:Transcript_8057/g.6011  ORF Transcript_8057/g.6011 Transcript_8057/m.6011 type:complete len:143 (-) Transcript_8057:1052-1480(-)|eukprot:CAMPEP_0202964592 /NCGR_PEP_ID=MMETSP1396-20130829/8672_1 /ASSEMBLY_ACC=CAM_ASM_000872 /TAXON_ID= /ORGANISM="Pseudokeronopsis sp., Strain Brazil" /LENGTH=142 /DNA_ID=CAMNT_0049686807 /DNA_START=268 /DNA_END=696 /DNA_ORIENTATION=+
MNRKSLVERIDYFIQKIQELEDINQQGLILEELRIIFSTANSDINKVIVEVLKKNKLAPLAVQILEASYENEGLYKMQKDAVWILSNLAFCSDQILEKVLERDSKMIDVPAKYLSEKNRHVQTNNVLWYFGNLTAENDAIRT